MAPVLRSGQPNKRNTGDWSYTGGYGQAQPDNREAAQGKRRVLFGYPEQLLQRRCEVARRRLSSREKPFVCEDSDELLNFVRSRNPGLRL
ncbi:unnamed protein product [Danaus chrysippus]|uniref:(African queen) hypothetical protein n=1 Tax=Danaus chrysippus TaxID=151541 RepID=A0A8J2QT12_9NEOP|nr:unnamed protein product [Danaus chrysippus]